jgi:chromosome segregation ATPase
MLEAFTNRALVRTNAEKYPGDIAGHPNDEWIHVIEKSYADTLKARVAELEKNAELVDAHDEKVRKELAAAKDATQIAKRDHFECREQLHAAKAEIEFLKAQRFEFIKTRQESINEQDEQITHAQARIAELEQTEKVYLMNREWIEDAKEREQTLVAACWRNVLHEGNMAEQALVSDADVLNHPCD